LSLSPGSRLGVYDIIAPIGAGGMVLCITLATPASGVTLTLKVISGGRDDNRIAGNRLLREARAAAALNHPNICTIYEVGEIDGTTFIAMELVVGESLQAIVERSPLTAWRSCAKHVHKLRTE
jgi:eukaryotic-like serine/threonine-protein kinase